MPKLKLDDDGHVVVNDGKPVYVYEDGREISYDAEETALKFKEVNDEAKKHRLNYEEVLEKLKPFEGMDPEKSKKALETVANFDAKKLIDAGEVETLKKQMGDIFDREKTELMEKFTGEKEKFTEENTRLNSTVRHLLISSHFSRSPFFSGPEPKTILPPDMAAVYFGSNFKVEGEGSNAKIIGYINDEKIPSREKIGDVANFEEAISAIIDAYPYKERIMRTTGGGSGAGGGLEGDGRVVSLSKADMKDPDKYRRAKEKAEKAGIPLKVSN